MEKTKDILVQINDTYGETCLGDGCNLPLDVDEVPRKPQGSVEVFEVDEEGNKKLLEKSNNLVLYQGREYLAEMLLNTNNANTDPDTSDFLCWFGLGDGGADPADPFTPYPPTNNDTSLVNDIPFSTLSANHGDLRTGYYYKQKFDSAAFEQDSANDNAWLVVNITTTIIAADANDYELSEAGLYLASSDTTGYSGDFWLFARVTYPVIVKTSSRRLVFVWYLYF